MTEKKKVYFGRSQLDTIALWLRHSDIPQVHLKAFCYQVIPKMLEHNTAFNYERFFSMVTGEKYKGINYNEN